MFTARSGGYDSGGLEVDLFGTMRYNEKPKLKELHAIVTSDKVPTVLPTNRTLMSLVTDFLQADI